MHKITNKFTIVLLIIAGLLLISLGVFYFLVPKLTPEQKLTKTSEQEGKSKFTIYGQIVTFEPPFETIAVSVESASPTVEIIPGQDTLVYLSQPRVLDTALQGKTKFAFTLLMV